MGHEHACIAIVPAAFDIGADGSHASSQIHSSLAGGISLGLFIAFTPTIPFQMTLACLGALYFRVNLPAALLVATAAFVSNLLLKWLWKETHVVRRAKGRRTHDD